MSFNKAAYDVFLKVKNGSVQETIEYLSDLRWDVSQAVNRLGWTVLHVASYRGNLELVQFLVAMGSDINAENSSSYTPRQLAEYKGHENVVEFLKACSAGQPVAARASS